MTTEREPSDELVSLVTSMVEHGNKFYETCVQIKLKAEKEGFTEDEINYQIPHWGIAEEKQPVG